jgi:hypothetical protein
MYFGSQRTQMSTRVNDETMEEGCVTVEPILKIQQSYLSHSPNSINNF